jgi:sugar lactone lactonase YvrE
LPILLISLLCVACTTTGGHSPTEHALPELVWPGPPATPRIQLVQLFDEPSDLGLNQSFFERLKSWFAGAEDLRMKRPYSISVYQDRIAVADPDAASVHLFDLQRQRYRRIERAGDQPLMVPIAVSISAKRIFVADAKQRKVFIFNDSLELVDSLNGFQRPTGLAHDPQRQQLYVTDTLAHAVSTFDRNGELLYRIGQRGEGEGQFNYPSHLAYRNGKLFVNDTMNFRLKVFSDTGEFLNAFGQQGDAVGAIGQSKGVAVDPDGHVYIADSLAGRIQIFDQDGVFLLDFGQHGSTPGQFQLPAGIAFWEDKLYVADSHNGRIQVFRYLGKEN